MLHTTRLSSLRECFVAFCIRRADDSMNILGLEFTKLHELKGERQFSRFNEAQHNTE